MINRVLSIFVICLFLAGCTSDKIDVLAKPINIDVARTADPDAVNMLPVNFKVVNSANLDQFISDLSKSQKTTTPIFIAITTDDYENLSLNFADLRRYIAQQKAVIVYYRALTTTDNTSPATQ